MIAPTSNELRRSLGPTAASLGLAKDALAVQARTPECAFDLAVSPAAVRSLVSSAFVLCLPPAARSSCRCPRRQLGRLALVPEV